MSADDAPRPVRVSETVLTDLVNIADGDPQYRSTELNWVVGSLAYELLAWRKVGTALMATMQAGHRVDCPLCGKSMDELVDNVTVHLFWCAHARAVELARDQAGTGA